MLDKSLRILAYYGLFMPLTGCAIVINRISLALFITAAWFISPWYKVQQATVNIGENNGK